MSEQLYLITAEHLNKSFWSPKSFPTGRETPYNFVSWCVVKPKRYDHVSTWINNVQLAPLEENKNNKVAFKT